MSLSSSGSCEREQLWHVVAISLSIAFFRLAEMRLVSLPRCLCQWLLLEISPLTSDHLDDISNIENEALSLAHISLDWVELDDNTTSNQQSPVLKSQRHRHESHRHVSNAYLGCQ